MFLWGPCHLLILSTLKAVWFLISRTDLLKSREYEEYAFCCAWPSKGQSAEIKLSSTFHSWVLLYRQTPLGEKKKIFYLSFLYMDSRASFNLAFSWAVPTALKNASAASTEHPYLNRNPHLPPRTLTLWNISHFVPEQENGWVWLMGQCHKRWSPIVCWVWKGQEALCVTADNGALADGNTSGQPDCMGGPAREMVPIF